MNAFHALSLYSKFLVHIGEETITMMNWISKSIKIKLILLFTGIIIVIVVSIGTLSYYQFSKTVKGDIVKFSSQILRQANLNLERYYREYEQGIVMLGTSRQYQDWISYDKEKKGSLFTSLRLIKENFIIPLMTRHPEILSLTLWSSNGVEYHFTAGNELHLDYSIMQESWIDEVRPSEKVFIRVGLNDNYIDKNGGIDSLMVMTLAKQFGFPNTGYIKMDISLEPAQFILNQLELGENSVGLIADSEGTIIMHPDLDMIGNKLENAWLEPIYSLEQGSFFVEETKEMVVFETIPFTQWKSIAIVSYPMVAKSVYQLRTFTIMIATGGILLAILLVIFFTSSITKRISQLRQTIIRSKLGVFKQQVIITGNDEIADLSMSYNQMVDHLDETVHQLAEVKMHQQKAVLTALQSQINSHFLYNTLETINSMAILADHHEIEQMTINLSNMLRYTSAYRDVMVMLEEEIKHMEDYLNICKIRYSGSLTYQIYIDDSCRGMTCLKAILQPVVENAIKHCLEITGNPIHIVVHVQEVNDMMQIRIQDNGEGFSKSALYMLRQNLSETDQMEDYNKFTNVGLANVHYRLRMTYKHDNAGLTIFNNQPNGAVVMISFPIDQSDEGRQQL